MSFVEYIIHTNGLLILVLVLVTNETISQVKNTKANR